MATITVPFDEIGFHPEIENPREELKDIDELKASIRAVGLQVPLTVLHHENKTGPDGEKCDKYYLIVGFRRHEAITQLRVGDSNAFRTVEVRRFKGSIAEAQVLNLTENIQRSELTPTEIAKGVEILLNLGYKQKEIAQKIGKSQTWVSNAMGFQRLATPQLKSAVREGQISYGFGRAIASLSDGEQRERVAQIVGAMPPASSESESIDSDSSSNKKVEANVRKQVRESSGRAIRPSTIEIRDEVNRLEQAQPDLDEFNVGILVALNWTLGEYKTLKKPS